MNYFKMAFFNFPTLNFGKFWMSNFRFNFFFFFKNNLLFLKKRIISGEVYFEEISVKLKLSSGKYLKFLNFL